jgi:hypothetical protein
MNRTWVAGSGLALLVVAVILFALSDASAGKFKYVEGEVVSGGSISGVIKYNGPLKDVRIDLMKEKNGETCARHPEAKDGIRFDRKILISNDHGSDGLLQDAVVFIEHIEKGKAWEKKSDALGGTGFTNFHFKNCDIVPNITVVRKTAKGETVGNLTAITHDGGVLHNPIGYLVAGSRRKVLFNKPLSADRLVADATKSLQRLKRKDKHFFLQCGQHNYMEAEARIVWNPYYSVTDVNGSFTLDRIPAGTYKVTAWHPYAGERTREVIVSEGVETHADFTVE